MGGGGGICVSWFAAGGPLFRKHRNQLLRFCFLGKSFFVFLVSPFARRWLKELSLSMSGAMSGSTSSSSDPPSSATPTVTKPAAAKAHAKQKGSAVPKPKPRAKGKYKSAEAKAQTEAARRQREKLRRQAAAKAQSDSDWRSREGLGYLESLPRARAGSSLPVEWSETGSARTQVQPLRMKKFAQPLVFRDGVQAPRQRQRSDHGPTSVLSRSRQRSDQRSYHGFRSEKCSMWHS